MNLLAFIQAKHNLIFKVIMVLISAFVLSLMLPDRQVKGHRVDAFSLAQGGDQIADAWHAHSTGESRGEARDAKCRSQAAAIA